MFAFDDEAAWTGEGARRRRYRRRNGIVQPSDASFDDFEFVTLDFIAYLFFGRSSEEVGIAACRVDGGIDGPLLWREMMLGLAGEGQSSLDCGCARAA